MSSKRLTILLLVALFAIHTLATDTGAGYKCTHDEQDKPEPEFMDIEEDFNPEGNDHTGRTLASYNNMRFYGYYGELERTSGRLASYIQNDLIPPVLSYFSAALRVKYPVTGLWRTNAGSVCGVSTPSVLREGVEADFIYFVDTDSSGSFVATSYTCNMASGSNRPIAGKTTISTMFVPATDNILNHEKNMICMMHELTHTLGFSTSLYNNFINANGQRMSGHVMRAPLDGSTSTVVNVEPLTTRLRQHFGCSNLIGAYMENSGSSATAGSHFERKIFTYEMMTSGLIYQQHISEFSLALLEGSGWYVPDYNYADLFWWGQGQGCRFVTGGCPAGEFSEYCTGSARGCSNAGRGAGSCSSDTRADGCKWVIPNPNLDCDNPDAEANSRLGNIQTYGRGENAKCFMGTLNNRNSGSNTNFCFKFTCSGSGSNTRLTLKVGGQDVVCNQEGSKTVSGYAGVVQCPDPNTFCQTVGAPVCPRNCMGRGTCVSGTCQCDSGFKGVDCALRNAF